MRTDKPVDQERVPGTEHKVISHPTKDVSFQISVGRASVLTGQNGRMPMLLPDLVDRGQDVHVEDVQRIIESVSEGQKADVMKKNLKEKLGDAR